jgi:hypothetical protein
MAVEQAKDMIAKQLKDPESAQFQNVVFRETEVISETHFGSICGEVNAKNSFGGYTGYKRFTSKFSYTNDGSFNAYGTTIESTDSDPFFNDEWNNNCK